MPAKKTEGEIPKYVTAGTLGGFVGLTGARITAMAQEGKIPMPLKKGHFLLRECNLAILEEARGRNAAKPGAEAIQRRNEAEANSAEINAAKNAGETIMIEDAQAIAADYALQVRRLIEEAGLPVAQTKRLLLAVSKIKLETPEGE